MFWDSRLILHYGVNVNSSYPASRCFFGRSRAMTIVFGSILLLSSASPAVAAGYALKEYSLSGMGSAYAGASAQADGPEFVSFNPATSSGVADWDASFTINGIYPTSSAVFSTATNAAATSTGGDMSPDGFIKDAYEPGLQLRYRLTQDLTAGLSVTAPCGLSTRYNEGWAGRYYALESKLITVNTVPSLAYQATPELALSAGMQIQYAKGTLSNAIDFGTIGGGLPTLQDGSAEVNADDWGFGFVLGVLWKPSPVVSIGAAYRSEVEHRLEGDVDFVLDTAGIGAALSLSGAFTDMGASVELTTPAVASLGGAFDIDPQFTVLAEVGLTMWSVFDELRVRFANPVQPDEVKTYDWKDTFFVSAGVRYRPAPDWTLRTGVAFDQSPTKNATRDPRIPDADRTWLAFSVRYDVGARTSLDLGYGHLFIPEEPIALSAAAAENLARGNLIGMTDSAVDVVTLQLTFR
jgi:long-chain fatty acid transport protein